MPLPLFQTLENINRARAKRRIIYKGNSDEGTVHHADGRGLYNYRKNDLNHYVIFSENYPSLSLGAVYDFAKHKLTNAESGAANKIRCVAWIHEEFLTG